VVTVGVRRAFDGGDPAVTTILDNPSIRPGGLLQGHVVVVADQDVTVDQAALSLVTEVDGGFPIDFYRVVVAGPFAVLARRGRAVPFSVPVPWQTPVTHLPGQTLPAQPVPGTSVALRTDLAVTDALDASASMPVYVYPLPVQERILEGFASAGFGFRHAVLRRGRIPHVRQTVPLYQEIGLWPPPDYTGVVTELEVIFLADPAGVDVILGVDRWAGLVTHERPSVIRFRVDHHTAGTDWERVVRGWVREAVRWHTTGHRPAQHAVPGPPGHSSQSPYRDPDGDADRCADDGGRGDGDGGPGGGA
jgi:sporulation-control protein